MKTCSHCGKYFSRGYNLQRHMDNSCPMLSNSNEDNIEYSEDTYEKPEHKYDEEMEEDSQTDEDVSDDENEEHNDDDDDMSDSDSQDSENIEESVWSPIIEEAKARHHQGYEELVQKLLNDGFEEETARSKAYHHILSQLQREARHIYLNKLKWIREMRKDPINRKVMETKQSFMDEDEFDGEEALEAAVKKRKFLLNRIFEDDVGYDTDDEDNATETY